MKVVPLSCLGFWLTGLVACAASAPPALPPASPPSKPCVTPTITISLMASNRANPAPDGEGRPVQVRAYQLTSAVRFGSASFEEIWQRDKEVLQRDLLQVEQYPLFPGQPKEVTFTPAAQANNLVLVALFREPQGRDWYANYELAAPPEKGGTCPNPKRRISVWLDRMQIQDGQGRINTGSTVKEK